MKIEESSNNDDIGMDSDIGNTTKTNIYQY